MQKIRNKVLSVFLACTLLFGVIPTSLYATNANKNVTENTVETHNVSDTSENISINESYVSALRVKEVVDGLAPFDSDNNPGNDANASNGIVRSFDNINYTLEYVTELKTNIPIEETYLMIEFTLPCTKDIATFDMDTMAWIIDPELTEENGVQKLTGKRLLQNTGGTTSVPGQGILSTGIKVQAAPNGTVIQPTFKLWMEGNELSEAKSTNSSKITVSSAPNYNVHITRNTELNLLGKFNTQTGEMQLNGGENTINGRLQGFEIYISLFNNNSAKGLKGIELPQGQISFDVTFKESTNSNIDTSLITDKNYQPFLWDYKENTYEENKGYLNRNMLWKNNDRTKHGINIPYNKGGTKESCTNGGQWQITQLNQNTYRITINNYKIDPSHFPNYRPSSNTPSFTDNIGIFSTGYLEVLLSFPESTTNVQNIYLSANVNNFSATSVSGQKGKEVNNTDDLHVSSITLYPPGTISKDLRLADDEYGYPDGVGDISHFLSASYTEGNSGAMKGEYFYLASPLYRISDYAITAFNYLVKFDASGIEIDKDKSKQLIWDWSTMINFSQDKEATILYAAKKDKTNWSNITEQTLTRDNELIYFNTLEELEANGYICVGLLYEVRNVRLYTGSYNVIAASKTRFKVKDEAQANRTYAITSDFKVWEEQSITHTYKNNNQGAAPVPTAYYYTDFANGQFGIYQKTEYDSNGVMLPGSHYGGHKWGQSLLICGYKASITKDISTLYNNEKKTTFDMDANERTVEFTIVPSTTTTITPQTPRYTTLYIEDILPKDLTYINESAYYDNKTITPQVIKNNDGTTTLKFTLPNSQINKTLPSIKYSCTIGKAGTTQDVVNNQIISTGASIKGDEDIRQPSSFTGNYDEDSLIIIKLNAVSILKETDTPFVGIGQNFNYNFKFANNSENKISNAKLYDVLPYVGDGRNSKFSGTYTINSITADFSNAPKTFETFKNNSNALQYATDLSAKNNNFSSINSFKNWITAANKSVNTNAKTITYTNLPAGIVALAINTDLEGFEYIDINLSMSGSGQKEGDVYVNSIFQNADGQLKEVNSNRAAVQIYGSLEVTKIWDDQNNEYNTRPSTLKITVYQDNNIYKELTLSSTDKVGTDNNTWRQRIANVPLYKIDGTPYNYTIQEDTTNISLRYFYETPVYDQPKLTVTNTAQFIPTETNEYPEYKIIVHKNIVDKDNNIADSEDFEQVALDINDTYNFAITLKELNRTVTNTGTSLVESYNGYSGNIINGIVTNKGDLIFNLGENGSGKYEISENLNQYFDFVDIEKLNDEFNTSGASFSKENGKYYITLSGLTGEFEQISVKVTNQIRPDRPYNETEDKINLFS